MIVPALLPLRVKKSVLPSGMNDGEPSFAGPDITPGAKIVGVGPAAATVASPAAQASAMVRYRTRRYRFLARKSGTPVGESRRWPLIRRRRDGAGGSPADTVGFLRVITE